MFPRPSMWLTVGLLLTTAPSASAEVRLSIGDGRVSLVATDATLGEILAEWERVGSTRIENGDRVTGPPMTLRLDDMPESQALGILLRTVNGYIAVSRQGAANGSQFDRIMIMPGRPRPRPSTRAAAAAPATPFTTPDIEPVFEPQDEPLDDQEPDSARPVRTVPPPAARGAVFGVFPQPQNTPPPDARTPGSGQTPAAQSSPQGVPVPGMIVPSPQDDQQPSQGR